MSNFATLKKSSSSLDRLTEEIAKINSPGTFDNKKTDDRIWKLERDKSGNGSAVIRFLPSAAVDGDDALPWVRYFDHGFKGPNGKWYIENSLTSLNQKDPVSEYNSQLWNISSDDNSPTRKQAREQKRRLHYVSNIYVISDPKHPENEGKIFLFKYGKKIFDKITLLMNPEFDGDVPVNPFDLWKGANFKLRIRTVEGYPNYDQSVFDLPKPLFDDDAELEKIWKQEHSLGEFLDPKNFKSYEYLKQHLEEVLEVRLENKPGKADVPTKEDVFKQASSRQSVTSDDDDDLKAFRALAED